MVQLRLVIRLTQRSLAAAGALVALTTLSLGAAVIVQQQRAARIPVSSAPYAPGIVVIFGAVGSAIVAAIYLPSAVGIRDAAERLAADLFPWPDEPNGSGGLAGQATVDLLDQRAKLIELVGVLGNLWAGLQAGLAILAPLLAAAATVFLTPS